MMIESLGFPRFFYHMVKTLMKDGKACVEVNGSKSDNFNLSRSIRQGCPLTPAIFVIVVDVLYYLLRDNSFFAKVQGVSLSNGEGLSNIHFSNDTTILGKLEEDNLCDVMHKLDVFLMHLEVEYPFLNL